ncbi:hypothetical protein D3C75_1151310 [compost metagenome]
MLVDRQLLAGHEVKYKYQTVALLKKHSLRKMFLLILNRFCYYLFLHVNPCFQLFYLLQLQLNLILTMFMAGGITFDLFYGDSPPHYIRKCAFQNGSFQITNHFLFR